jgi:hypothetical protein
MANVQLKSKDNTQICEILAHKVESSSRFRLRLCVAHTKRFASVFPFAKTDPQIPKFYRNSFRVTPRGE